MDKQQLLAELGQMARAGLISETEVLGAFGQTAPTPAPESFHQSLKLSDVMYYIGAGIVFLGIIILCYQNWDYFTPALKILIALGGSVSAYVVGALFYTRDDLRKVSQGFFLISGILAPMGVYVSAKEFGYDLGSDSVQVMVYLILSVWFLGLLRFFKQTILLFFGVVFAGGLFHTIISLLIGQTFSGRELTTIFEYRILVLGLVWMLLGYYFNQTSFKAITGVFYGFGSLFTLGAALSLGGYGTTQNIIWELFYPLVVFGIIYLSVYVKSKSFLVFGTIFLIIYILKITGEYFTSGLGWPLALVLAGFATMAVGYGAVKVNQKYLKDVS